MWVFERWVMSLGIQKMSEKYMHVMNEREGKSGWMWWTNPECRAFTCRAVELIYVLCIMAGTSHHQQLEHPITLLLVVIKLSEPMIMHSVYHHCGEWILLWLQLCGGCLSLVDI